MQVGITGRWERPRTFGWEVRSTRDLLGAVGPHRDIDVSFVVKRSWGGDSGTFVAWVEIPGRVNLSATQRRTRATQILRWFLADYCCRPPKLRGVELVDE